MSWIKKTQSTFSESFFPVLNGRYFLFHHRPLWASKYTFANSRRPVLVNDSGGESCNSVRWNHRTQRSFSDSFFLTFSGRYFLWPYSLQREPNYPFSDSTEKRLARSPMKYSCRSVSGSHTSQSSLSESFFPVFIWGYFLFHHRPLCASIYPFVNSTRTVLANGFWRGKLQLWEMYSQISKKFLKKLLSSFDLRIFPFSP